MALHDRYLRRTPFELVFPELEAAVPFVDAVLEEARARGVDPNVPQMFATLGSVAAKVLAVRGDETPTDGGDPYAALVFHAWHFARAGTSAHLITTAAARALVEGSVPAAPPRPSAPAGYLQLPQHLFWVEADPQGVPESIDGLFWVEGPGGVLHTLLVTGLRPDRPGLGIVPLPEVPLADAETWLGAAVREPGEGRDFESAIPGAGLDALYGVRTAGEALKLLARFFAAAAGGWPSSEVSAGLHGAAAGQAEGGPAPSALPCRRMDARA